MAHNKQQPRSFHLFAGAGGGILADLLLGHRVVGACEIEKYPREVLLQRQRDGILPEFPIWDDVQTLDGKPWRGLVDIVAGGFPCQDISCAGKGEGIDGARSGLWSEMARVIREVGPRFVFVENSPMLTSRGLGTVLGDLAEMGYDARWCVLGACDAGAPHRRDRIWILADNNGECVWDEPEPIGWGERSPIPPINGEEEHMGHASSIGFKRERASGFEEPQAHAGQAISMCPSKRAPEWWITEPDVGRVAHGVASRVDRLKALGNGQVPAVAALAWRILSQ